MSDIRKWINIVEAKVPLDMLPTKLFHGTKKQFVKSILAHGIQPSDFVAFGTKNTSLRPLTGRVYMTPNAKYAAMYGKYLFVINRESIAGDLLPDEDEVGEIYHWLSCYKQLDMDKIRKTHSGNSQDFVNRLEFLLCDQKQAIPVMNFTNFMRHTLSKTPKLHNDLLGGEYTAWAKGGKKALKTMPDSIVLWLISIGVHVSHDGPVIPDEAWEIHSLGLLPDGSNLSDVANRIDYNKGNVTPMPPKGPPIKFEVVFEYNKNWQREGSPKFVLVKKIFIAPSKEEAIIEAELFIDHTVKEAGYRIVSVTNV